MVAHGSRAIPARYFPTSGVTGALTRNGASSRCSVASYWKGNCCAYGSRKKSKGFKTAISATRSTSMRSSRAGLGKATRAR